MKERVLALIKESGDEDLYSLLEQNNYLIELVFDITTKKFIDNYDLRYNAALERGVEYKGLKELLNNLKTCSYNDLKFVSFYNNIDWVFLIVDSDFISFLGYIVLDYKKVPITKILYKNISILSEYTKLDSEFDKIGSSLVNALREKGYRRIAPHIGEFFLGLKIYFEDKKGGTYYLTILFVDQPGEYKFNGELEKRVSDNSVDYYRFERIFTLVTLMQIKESLNEIYSLFERSLKWTTEEMEKVEPR